MGGQGSSVRLGMVGCGLVWTIEGLSKIMIRQAYEADRKYNIAFLYTHEVGI